MPKTKASVVDRRSVDRRTSGTAAAPAATLLAQMNAPDYHRRGPEAIKADSSRAATIEQELETCFARWAELEDKARAAAS